jgi:hypothetical protein
MAQGLVNVATVFLALVFAAALVIVPVTLLWGRLRQRVWVQAGGGIYRLITQQTRAEDAAQLRQAKVEQTLIDLGDSVFDLTGHGHSKQENSARVQKHVHTLRVLRPDLGAELDSLSQEVSDSFFDVAHGRKLLQPIIDATRPPPEEP